MLKKILVLTFCLLAQTVVAVNLALHEACITGDVTTVQELLQANPAILNVQDEFGCTALHCAILGRHVDIISLLLEAGSNVSMQDKNGFTALHMAAKSGLAQAIPLLVAKGASVLAQTCNGAIALHFVTDVPTGEALIQAGSPVDSKDIDGNTPLHYAENGAIAVFLLARGANYAASNLTGATPLHYAAAKDNVSVLSVLIDAAKDQKYLDTLDAYGCSAIFYASERGIKKLVASGASVTLTNIFKSTPLHFVSDGKGVDFLIDKAKISFSSKNLKNFTALEAAAHGANPDVIKKIRSRGLPVTSDSLTLAIKSGSLPAVQALGNIENVFDANHLIQAIQFASKDIVFYLVNSLKSKIDSIKVGVDWSNYSVSSSYGNYKLLDVCLQFALRFNRDDILAFLLNAGGSVQVRDGFSRLPIHLAKSIEAAKNLITYGADARSRTKLHKNTPLHLIQDVSLAEMYVKNYKVDINSKNIFGETPLHTAIVARSSQTYINKLLKLGADYKARTSKSQFNFAWGKRRTPLHYAALSSYVEATDSGLAVKRLKDALAVMRLIVSHVADHAVKSLGMNVDDAAEYVREYILLKDSNGQTALELVSPKAIKLEDFLQSME